MKYLLLIILLMAVILSAGCVVQNNNPPVPQTPQIVYVTVTVPVTQSVSETVIPIKGVEHSITNIQMIGNVYGLSSNTTAGVDQIKFSIGLAPGSPSVDLTLMKIVFSTPTTTPQILTQNNTGGPTAAFFTTNLNSGHNRE